MRTRQWERHYYARWLLISDSMVLLVSVFTAQFLRFGCDDPLILVTPTALLGVRVDYTALSVLIVAVWTLTLVDARDVRATGIGSTEFKRLFQSTFWTFGLLAIASVSLQTDIARGYIVLAFPLGLTLLILSRWGWRKWLHARRSEGHHLHHAIIVGEADKAEHVALKIGREPYIGYAVVGAITSPGPRHSNVLGVIRPWTTEYPEMIRSLVDDLGADTLILVSMNDLSPDQLRQIGWAMEESGVEMIVAPALTDIAGPRIHTRPVSGLPLIYIEYPRLEGINYWVKRLFDILVSALLLLILSPLLFAVAAAVKLSSPGPCLFLQQRVGRHGEPFLMLKFRSMVAGAEGQVDALQGQSDGNAVLFKMKSDPRVTRVGAFLRRFSLDELPQLVNVLRGEMSLVGPRPPLPSEVASYERWVHRRLLVKPGMTGMWQVSGRSDLSWEDSIRLDLYYVENWSMTSDLVLLWKTLRAVIGQKGAY